MLALLPAMDVEAMLHPLTGIAARCKFLPTAADVMEFVESRKSRFEPPVSMLTDSGYKRFEVSRRVPAPPARKPFRPFPKLWAAFENEPEVYRKLSGGLPFDQIDSAAKALAIRGRDDARKIIMRKSETSKWTPPAPRVDISDFPDRGAPPHMDGAA